MKGNVMPRTTNYELEEQIKKLNKDLEEHVTINKDHYKLLHEINNKVNQINNLNNTYYNIVVGTLVVLLIFAVI